MNESIDDALIALNDIFDEYAWLVESGLEHVLRINFGEPYLRINGPYRAKSDASPQIREILTRRRVRPTEQWHLFVEDGE